MKRSIFFLFLILFVFVQPVSAETFANGGFEYTMAGWNAENVVYSSYFRNSGSYSCNFYTHNLSGSTICQYIDLTGVDKITYYALDSNSDSDIVRIYLNEVLVDIGHAGDSDFVYNDVDVSGYEGIWFFRVRVGPQCYIYLDDIDTVMSESGEMCSIVFDRDPYHTGDTVKILVELPDFNSNYYRYYVDFYDTDNYITTFEIDSSIEQNTYFFPDSSLSTSLLAKLRRVDKTSGLDELQLGYAVSHFEQLDSSFLVSFDKSEYKPGDLMVINYGGLLSGSIVRLSVDGPGSNGEGVVWDDISGSGTLHYHVWPDTKATYALVRVYHSSSEQVRDNAIVIPFLEYDYPVDTSKIWVHSRDLDVPWSGLGSEASMSRGVSVLATTGTNINVDYVHVFYTPLSHDYDQPFNNFTAECGTDTEVLLPNNDRGEYRVIIEYFNVSTQSSCSVEYCFLVGMMDDRIDIYRSDAGSQYLGYDDYDGFDLSVPLYDIVYFSVYTDEIIDDLNCTSDYLYNSYWVTDPYYARRSCKFLDTGVYSIVMRVYNSETDSHDEVEWVVHVSGISVSDVGSPGILYWSPREITAGGRSFLYWNVSGLADPYIKIESADGRYKGEWEIPVDSEGSLELTAEYAKQYTATLYSNGTLYSMSHLTVLSSGSSDSGDFGGYSAGESAGDVSYDMKAAVYDKVGDSVATLFIVGAFIVAICAIGFASVLQNAAGGMLGAVLGLGIATVLGFIPMVWAVLTVILAGSVVAFVFKGGVG